LNAGEKTYGLSFALLNTSELFEFSFDSVFQLRLRSERPIDECGMTPSMAPAIARA